MYSLDSQSEYERIVAELAEEYDTEIDNHAVREVANAVTATFDVVDHEATVQHAATVWGERVEATDSEALDPYEVIQYSEASIPMADVSGGQHDQAAARAAQMLARDLAEERGLGV